MAEEITFEKFLKTLLEALNKCGTGYMLIGGVAALYYGRPRTTSDCDIVLSTDEKILRNFARCMRKHGFRVLDNDVLASFREKNHFNAYLGDSPFRADFSWRTGSLNEHGFERAEIRRLHGIRVRIEAPEDVIVAKLVFGSPQDIEDAKSIIVRQKKLDKKYLKKRAREEGVKSKLEKAINSLK